MITMADLRPGDLPFGPIGGIVPGMFPVGAGQLLLADRKARLSWRRWRKIRHCGVIVQAGRAPRMVQAMPRGAEEIALRPEKHWTAEWVFIRPAYEVTKRTTTWPRQGDFVAHCAQKYVGTPYNFLTYAALATSAFGLTMFSAALRRKISTRKDMMCSQLADQALADAGFHVFDDGRLPQDVVPAELFRALLEMPGTQTLIPGQADWQTMS